MTLRPVPELPESEPATHHVAAPLVPAGDPKGSDRTHSTTGTRTLPGADGSGGGHRPTLSVVELQDALRAARARAVAGSGARLAADAPAPIGASPSLPAAPAGRRRVVVLAAHGGAGASTVALALAEAVAARGRFAHLVECAPPPRSGLLAAATAELGLDASGRWRRGTRGDVVIDRLAGDASPAELCWPADPASDREGMTIVDAGSDVRPGGWGDAPLLVVCRATVPGLRHAEHLLHRLARSVSVAVVGPPRWPGPVRAGVGPRLTECRRAGQVVGVPLDRALGLTGVHAAGLPRPLAASGRALLVVLDAAAPRNEGPVPC